MIKTGMAKVSEAAEFLSMGESTLYRLITSGKIPAKRYGANVRISWEWLNSQVDVKPEPQEDVVFGRIQFPNASVQSAR